MNHVIVYSHFFTVQNPEIELRKILYTLAADYTVFGMVFDEQRKKRVWKPVKTFGFYTKLTDEFRFHNGQLNRMLQSAQNAGLHLDVYHMPLYEPCKEVFTVQSKYVLREEQEEASDFIVDPQAEGSHAPLLSMPMGTGKALPLDAPLLTPTGWRLMKDIQVGDEVITRDGDTSLVTGVYPQGYEKVCSLIFEDKRETVCSYGHLWKVYIGGPDGVKVLTTSEIIERLVQNPDVELFIDLIKLSGYHAEQAEQVLEEATRLHDEADYYEFDRELGCGVLYYDSNEKANRLKELIHSLGGRAYIIQKEHGDSLLHYECPILVFDDPENESLKPLKISSFRSHQEEQQTQCIAIDHPEKLYVTKDYIVTHNTVTSLVAASRLGNRLAVSVLAGYVEKWYKDVQGTYEIDAKDIIRIEGKNSLVDYCQLLLENQATPEKLPKVTIISINTIGKWYKGYIEDPFNPTYDMYGMKPWELMEKARIGTNIFDESHQHLHAVYRMFCFLHIPKTISLSATLTSEEETELRIQRMMYPRHKRFEKIKMKRYITVYSCQYQIQDFLNSRIRTQEYGSNNYSHIAFEKSILSHRSIKGQYINMIVRMVRGSFVDTMQRGDKCAVFVSSHAMAREVCRAIRKEFPDLDTRTYLESDPIENLMDSDIRVTTVLSGGTAHDIGGLTVSIQTINLNSIKSNLQVLGRLREIIGRDIRFYYLYCSSIPKHVEYHQNKIEMFRDWCKERKDIMLDPLLPERNFHHNFTFR